MRNRDIIITSLQPFYLPIGSNCINIAEELSKQNRVLYVNYAFDRSSIKREKDKPHVKIRHEMKVGLKPNLELVKENLWTLSPTSLLESINWLPFTFLFRLFNRINNKRFSSEIKKAID